ncbi:UNVERIFIED_CONTAM: hypothetical protein HDU68_009698 [Siphonaria sp. JEL0065]|nr:hypothetical protein HDU68_009698 [Siphonaria sp. JEL0065]
MESTLSINTTATSSSKSTTTLAKAKKTLVQCKVCLGSSWVHGNEPAPFPTTTTTPSTPSSPIPSSPSPSSFSASLNTPTSPLKEFSFSPKPHCSECTKCKACTNGKQIGHSSSSSSSSNTSSIAMKTDSKDSLQSQSPQHTGLIKKRPPPPPPTTVTANQSSGLDHHAAAGTTSMDVVTFATLDTPAAVAAVSISRINKNSRHKLNSLRIANGEDDDDDDDDDETSQDENEPAAASRVAKRSANIKRRVQIMSSADNLASLSPTPTSTTQLSKKPSTSSLDNLSSSTTSTTTSSPLKKPGSTQTLSSSPPKQSSSSTASSKETVAVNSAGNSLSSIPSSGQTPAIIASSVSQSHVSLVGTNSADFYGTEVHHQHPAVNILSMGSGILARKRDTFIQGNYSSDALAREFGVAGGSGSGGGMTPSPSIVASGSGLQMGSGSGVASGSKSTTAAGAGGVLGDSSSLIGDSCADREEFPELIDLGTVFGTKLHLEATKTRLIWSARLYEGYRKEYLSRPLDEDEFPERPPTDEIKYRILENFDEGRLTTVTYATRETGSEFISSGDIESLVDALIFPLNQDNSYTEVFLASYRFFMPASELLTSLIEWYNVELDPSTATPSQEVYFKQRRRLFRGRAAKVLLTWIKNHWHDFHVDRELLDELNEFVGDLGEVCFGDGQRMTQAIREQRLSWYMTQYIPPFSAKRAPSLESAKPWGLLWEPEAFAAQLTLIDHHYFRQIRPDMYLSLLQKRVPREKCAGDASLKVLMDYVSWFRLVSSYTASLIYKEDTTKKRTKAIKRFIKVAKELRMLNNFNTMFAVLHGLKRNLVAKMTGAWDGLAGKHVEGFKEMEALMDPKGGFANFWGELKNCVAPLIPFFAAYIQDLLEIHETEPVFTRDLATNNKSKTDSSGYKIVTTDDDPEDDIINFSKFYNLYSIVAEIEVWRSYSYNSVIPEAAAAANDPKGDTCAVVLNHMRDWKCVEDSLLDL